jgi:hypothetical protein
MPALIVAKALTGRVGSVHETLFCRVPRMLTLEDLCKMLLRSPHTIFAKTRRKPASRPRQSVARDTPGATTVTRLSRG